MIEYKTNKQAVIARVVCNKCGKELKVKNGIVHEDFCRIDKSWGYFSDKDGQRDQFDLCERCYDAIISEFAVPVKNIDEKELI